MTMRPMIIHTPHFPPKGFHAITLFPFVFYNGAALMERDIRHETVHLWQQAVLLVVPFYLLYLIFWVINLLRFRNLDRAYREIPFERSAYGLENRTDITWKDKSFDWLKA